MQAELVVHRFEGFARQQDAEVLLADEEIHAHRGGGDAERGAAGVAQKRAHRIKQAGNHAHGKQQPAQTHAENHDGLGEEHALQPAARNQFGDVLKRIAFEFVAAVKPRAELLQIGRAVEIGNGQRGGDGKQHGDHGVDAHQRQHHQKAERNQRIGVNQPRGLKLGAENIDAVQIIGGNVGQQPQH